MGRSLTYYGNPVLRKKASPIEEINDWVKDLAHEMIAFTQKHRGFALAAPQVGELVRLFIICHDDITPDGQLVEREPQVFINPKLSDPSSERWMMDEACFSIPGIHVPVERPVSITIEALDLEGKPFTETRKGLPARVVMHENDHLNGVLSIDRTSQKDRNKVEVQLRAIKKKYN